MIVDASGEGWPPELRLSEAEQPIEDNGLLDEAVQQGGHIDDPLLAPPGGYDEDYEHSYDDHDSDEEVEISEEETSFELGVGRFTPPLYFQRYSKVLEIIEDKQWDKRMNKIVDFGSAECRFVLHMKRLDHARQVVCVDVDEDKLMDAGKFHTKPNLGDLLDRRTICPMDVFLMTGSVADSDERLKDADVITAIELIEHLTPDVLSRVPANLFGYLRPKLAILTTPNQEFNFLFSKMEGQFRHWDHKFEWTRSEFEAWAGQVVSNYPDYSVEFHGIGYASEDTRHSIGGCTQMAVFKRNDFAEAARNGEMAEAPDGLKEEVFVRMAPDDDGCGARPYTLVARHTYPYWVDPRSPAERLRDSLRTAMHNAALRVEETCYPFEAEKVPLQDILYEVGFLLDSDDQLLAKDESIVLSILHEEKLPLETDGEGRTLVVVPKNCAEESEEEEDWWHADDAGEDEDEDEETDVGGASGQ